MAGLIKRGDIDEVRQRVNIADVVGDYVTLKSAGVGSMKGLCPFHDERSPSFHVRPQAGFYHCFGCGEGGDAYSFLQKIDHLSFQEAVERLAERVGYQLTYEDGSGGAPAGNRARLYAANQAAEKFFREHLGKPEAELGRAFLGERGFDALAAERFGVGYAPASYDALSKHLVAAGFTIQELLDAGLVSQGDRGVYDRFRGRLVWPIRDVTGQTIGFGARKLREDDQGPKYLNTPETAVYHKSRVLYGLDLAKRDIAKQRQVVIVEGYTDVMACHLAGITTAVATCGTAFGGDHVTVVRRVLGDSDDPAQATKGEVIFTFDPDEAGQKAASRAFAEESRFAAQTFVAVPPEGLDPCDVRITKGDEALREVIAHRRPMYEFMIKQVMNQCDLNTVEGRTLALRAAAPVVSKIRDRVIRDGYARELAGWLGMNPDDVLREIRAGATNTTPATSPTAPAPEGDKPYTMESLSKDPVTTLERDVLMVLLQHPDVVPAERATAVLSTQFSHAALALVRDAMLSVLDKYQDGAWVSRVTAETPEALQPLVGQLSVAPLPESKAQTERYCLGVTATLLDRDLLRQKAELMSTLQRTDAAADPAGHRVVQEQLVTIEAQRRALRDE
ncbi:DNA primase [Pontimonas sp.]|nr:DNA primase [Pontimonas sp.]MDA8886976.1 DNA primase [Pontimonas sp.]MDP4633679.1 DNA primase [Pontimonas sp.]